MDRVRVSSVDGENPVVCAAHDAVFIPAERRCSPVMVTTLLF